LTGAYKQLGESTQSASDLDLADFISPGHGATRAIASARREHFAIRGRKALAAVFAQEVMDGDNNEVANASSIAFRSYVDLPWAPHE